MDPAKDTLYTRARCQTGDFSQRPKTETVSIQARMGRGIRALTNRTEFQRLRTIAAPMGRARTGKPITRTPFMPSTLCLALLALVSPSAPAPGEAAPAIKAAKDHIDFLIGKELVTRYYTGEDVAKPYFWPLNAPGG